MTTGIRTAGIALVMLLALVGCTTAPMPVPTAEPEPSRTPGAITTAPELRPGASAAANQQYFDVIVQLYQTNNGMGTSRTLVDFLVEKGFEKADIEVTPDATAINIPADSIVVSVRIKGECLIGQVSVSGYAGTIAPVLGTGRCLIGQTLPIDW